MLSLCHRLPPCVAEADRRGLLVEGGYSSLTRGEGGSLDYLPQGPSSFLFCFRARQKVYVTIARLRAQIGIYFINGRGMG